MNGAAALLEKKGLRARAPVTVTFQVTDRCHMGCVHCYETHGDDAELTLAEIDRILGEVAAEGTLFLNLTGGEFFMRRDAEDILVAARRHGFAVKLLTTGWHIDDRRADFIRDLGSIQVDLSFYSGDPAVHDAITQIKGSWQRTLAAAERLRARGVLVTLKSPVMGLNIDQVHQIREVARRIGAQFQLDPKVTAREDGERGPLALRADDAALTRYYGDDRLGIWSTVKEAFADAHLRGQNRLDETPCRAAHDVCGINPQGLVSACHSIPDYAGDLHTQSFRQIWREAPLLERMRKLTWGDLDECNRCEVRPYCSRCHAMALVEDGSIDGPSSEACRHAVILRDLLRDRGVLAEGAPVGGPPLKRVRPPGLRVID